MSYHEKRALVGTAGAAALAAAYCIYAFGKLRAGLIMPGDLRFWAVTMLVFIGIGVVLLVAVQIVFNIVCAVSLAAKEAAVKRERPTGGELDRVIQTTFTDDEMVRLIELKASRVGYAVSGIGFVAGLAALALGQAAAVMLNVAFLSAAAGCLADGIASIVYFRRGVGHA